MNELGNIDNKICYSDESTIVININERLVLLQFDNSNITAYAFDDILLNFRGKLGIKYISILADLINSKVIKQEDIIIFYNRMITFPDDFDFKGGMIAVSKQIGNAFPPKYSELLANAIINAIEADKN